MDFYDVIRLIGRASGVLDGGDLNLARKAAAAIDAHEADYPATTPPSPEAVGANPAPVAGPEAAPVDTTRLDRLEAQLAQVTQLLLQRGAHPSAPTDSEI